MPMDTDGSPDSSRIKVEIDTPMRLARVASDSLRHTRATARCEPKVSRACIVCGGILERAMACFGMVNEYRVYLFMLFHQYLYS